MSREVDACGASRTSSNKIKCRLLPALFQYLLPHLDSGWAVDQAILNEEERVVVVRFGHDYDSTCMQMDEVLAGIADSVKNFAVIYVVDISQVRRAMR
jgi:thiol-disulfide isomerase/thioredoxin